MIARLELKGIDGSLQRVVEHVV